MPMLFIPATWRLNAVITDMMEIMALSHTLCFNSELIRTLLI